MGLEGKWLLAYVVLLLVAEGVNAAPQIQNYTVSPERLKAGMSGSINIVFYNPSSTEYISGAQLDASASQLEFSGGTSLGDMGTLGTTVTSVGFKVKDDATPGIYTVKLTLSYTTSAGASTGYKIFSIPLTVYPNVVIQVKDFKASKSVINPGDSFGITAKIASRGGELRHVVLSFPSSSNFSLEDATKIDVGALKDGMEHPLSFNAIAGERAVAGYYSIPMTISYDDAVSTSNTETIYFGPVTVAAETSRIDAAAINASFNPGSQVELEIELRNNGDTALENVRIALPETSEFFVPLDFGEKTVSRIAPRGSETVSFNIGVKTNIAPQVYQIPLSIRYESKTLGSKEYTKNVGVKVAGTPAVAVIVSTSPAPLTASRGEYTLSVQVSNVGNTAIRAVSTEVSSDILEFVGTREDYLGTLNLDDYSTSQYAVVVKPGAKPGRYPVFVTVSYKDAYNTPYVQQIRAEIEVASAELAALSAKPQPTNPLYVIVGLAVIAVVLYFGYKRFFKKKKHVE